MPPRPWFQDWFDSAYYHLLYFNRDVAEAAAFIDGLLALLKPKEESRMLDVACGRGRHSRYLATKGYDVTGIDLSPNSITYAKQYESDNLHFYQHDMRLPFRVRYFQFAFNFFTSFGYFPTRREHDDAFRMIAQSLTEDGAFVLDYLNARYWENHLQHKMEIERDGVQFHITKWMDESHFYKRIEIEDEAQEKPLEFCEKIEKFSLGDFTEMLAYQGLQISDVFGDYQLAPFRINESPRIIIIARKK